MEEIYVHGYISAGDAGSKKVENQSFPSGIRSCLRFHQQQMMIEEEKERQEEPEVRG